MEKALNEHINDLIMAHLEGDIGAAGAEKLRLWTESSDENRKYLEACQEVWFSSHSAAVKERHPWEPAYERFLKKTSKKPSYKRYVRIAAMIVVIFLTAYAFYSKGTSDMEKELADVSIEVPLGSQMTISLPDGTKVRMNSGSTISYSQGFGITDRDIRLEGEGYFDVKHQERLPLTIHTSDFDIKDLGTKFNVCDYAEDKDALVELQEGGVEVTMSRGGTSAVMHPNQRLVVDKRTGRYRLSDVAREEQKQWNEGTLNFNNMRMGDIAKVLSRSYGVTISFRNSRQANMRYYGTFSRRGQTVTDILDALSATGTMHYKITGNTILIY